MGKVTLDAVNTKLDMMHEYNQKEFLRIDEHFNKLNGKVDRHDKFISRFKGAGITLSVLGVLVGIVIGIVKLYNGG